jgi:hypothetical protein
MLGIKVSESTSSPAYISSKPGLHIQEGAVRISKSIYRARNFLASVTKETIETRTYEQ